MDHTKYYLMALHLLHIFFESTSERADELGRVPRGLGSANDNSMATFNDDPNNRFPKAVRKLQIRDNTTKLENPAPKPTSGYTTIRIIPWEDIWTSLRIAKMRGNGDMIDVFYDTLLKETIFDDKGAWSLHVSK